MGWLSVVLAAIAAFLLYKSGYTGLMILAIISTIGSFWSWGVMHNYATELAKRRQNYSGGFYDITPQEADAVPDWIAWLNMGFSLAAMILFVVGIMLLIV